MNGAMSEASGTGGGKRPAKGRTGKAAAKSGAAERRRGKKQAAE